MAIGREKRRVRDGLLANQMHVEPGIWVLTEPVIARHLKHGSLPASLRATKGLSGARGGLLRRMTRKMLYAGVPPFLVRTRHDGVQDRNSQLGHFSLLIMAKSGDVVMMDSAHSKVLKVGAGARVTADQMAIRERLARFLSVPTVQHFDNGKLILEPFMEGVVFSTLTNTERVTVFAELLQRYALLTAHDSSVVAPDYWRHALQFAQSLPLPAAAREVLKLQGNQLCERLQTVQCAPAHGDLSGSNILHNNEGPMLFDLEDCAVLPAFFDLYFLAHQEWQCGRTDSWELLTQSTTWSQMQSVLKPGVEWRTWLWGMFLCELFEWQEKIGGAALTRKVLINWWKPLAGILLHPDTQFNGVSSTQILASK